MSFMTEKQTEGLLEIEVRDLLLPNGTRRPFRATRYTWNAYDFLMENDGLTPESFMSMVVHDAELGGYDDLERFFTSAVGYLNGKYCAEIRRQLGED